MHPPARYLPPASCGRDPGARAKSMGRRKRSREWHSAAAARVLARACVQAMTCFAGLPNCMRLTVARPPTLRAKRVKSATLPRGSRRLCSPRGDESRPGRQARSDHGRRRPFTAKQSRPGPKLWVIQPVRSDGDTQVYLMELVEDGARTAMVRTSAARSSRSAAPTSRCAAKPNSIRGFRPTLVSHGG